MIAGGGFRRSTFCGDGGCVWVARPRVGAVAVSDGPHGRREVRVPDEAWTAFLAALRGGNRDA